VSGRHSGPPPARTAPAAPRSRPTSAGPRLIPQNDHAAEAGLFAYQDIRIVPPRAVEGFSAPVGEGEVAKIGT